MATLQRFNSTDLIVFNFTIRSEEPSEKRPEEIKAAARVTNRQLAAEDTINMIIPFMHPGFCSAQILNKDVFL